MAFEVPLRLAELMPPVRERASCLEFVKFRDALKRHRAGCDDNIRSRLTSLQKPTTQCPKFEDNLKRAQASRMANLKFCLGVLKEELSSESDSTKKAVLRKEARENREHNFMIF